MHVPVGCDGSGPGPAGFKCTMQRRQFFVWAERALTTAIVLFVLHRLGPQVQAWTGVGPDLGRSPTYAFVALDGSLVDSEDLIGNVVVLNFWATWCAPCRLEMPALQELYEERAGDGVVVLGLATDTGRGSAVESFLSERKIDYPVGRATNAHRQAFGGINAIPTTFIIDRGGLVRHRVVGYFAPPAMRAAVNRLLNQPTSSTHVEYEDLSAGTVSAR